MNPPAWRKTGLALMVALRAASAPNHPGSPPLLPASNAMARAAEYSAKHGGRAFLVQVEGRILYERYDGGWNAELPHPLASGTKSFAGVLAMLAVQDGLLKLDEPAATVLPEWRDDARKSKITIRQLLQLCSGLPAGDRELSGPRSGSRLFGWAASNRVARLGLNGAVEPENVGIAALNLPLAHEPGTAFEYGPSHFHVFVLLLQRRLQASDRPERNVLQYLHRRLLEPLGIPNARIARDRAGNPNLAGGMMLTAREWARFGQFVADRGALRRPDGSLEPWLRPELLAECFQPSPANPHYGLTWWLPGGEGPDAAADTGLRTVRRRMLDLAVARPVTDNAGRPVSIWMAAGLGKQRLYVLPDRGWVVVRFGDGSRESVAFSDAELIQRLLETEASAAAPAVAAPLAPAGR
ncbi:MAG: beta-lactamase family protein [Kiritimatiellae bacterium]|nr:beta-lactamase family protein [Kiritimatiellia bacterium]